MKTALICIFFALIAVSWADQEFNDVSVKSHIFEPLRANRTPKDAVTECGKEITEPYGTLEHTYKRGSAKDGEKCTWHLKAPANHVVNIISVGFVLSDENQNTGKDEINPSTVTLYDGDEAGKRDLSTFYVKRKVRGGAFVASTSSQQDMIVEILYHDNDDFASQKMIVKYEFLEFEKMMELLRNN